MSYARSARVYDAIYASNDYAAQSQKLRTIIEHYQRQPSRSLLDVGCGTGAHLQHLKSTYDCAGIDLDTEMVAVARERNPDLTIVQGDMRDFQIGRPFDVVICLFSAIGYMHTPHDLAAALRNFAAHCTPDGLVIVEPWLHPENVQPPRLHALYVEHEGVHVTRMNLARIEGRLFKFDFHYMIGTEQAIETFVEPHALALYSDDEYRTAFAQADLTVLDNTEGFVGRGLYVAQRQTS